MSCHNPDKREGGVLLTGDRGPLSLHSFHQLTVTKQFKDGRNQPKSNFAPYERWDPASPLMKKLDGQHYDVQASPQEIKIVRHWINAGAYYPGTYAALGTGMIGGYEQNKAQRNDMVFPEVHAMDHTIQKRCMQCHKDKEMPLPRTASHETLVPTWVPQKKVQFSRHILYNLTRPDKSVLLLAPLAKSAGGYAEDNKKDAHPVVFKNTSDSGYQTILKGIDKTKRLLEDIGSFEMPGFKPRGAYVREMKRYGILPASFDVDRDALNVYDTDRLYFESLWHTPIGKPHVKTHNNPFPYPGMQKDNDPVKTRALWREAGTPP